MKYSQIFILLKLYLKFGPIYATRLYKLLNTNSVLNTNFVQDLKQECVLSEQQ